MPIEKLLPASHTVTKGPRNKAWLAEVTVDVARLPQDILAKLAMHGLHQKLADSASQSTTKDEALAAMQKAMDALIAGNWASRSSGSGLTERDKIARQIVRAWFTQADNDDVSAEALAKYKDADTAGRDAIIDQIWADNSDVFGDAVDEEIAARKAKAEKLDGLTVKISI